MDRFGGERLGTEKALRMRAVALTGLAVAVGLLLLWLMGFVVPTRMYPPLEVAELRTRGLEGKEVYDVQAARLELQNSLRISMVQALGGALAVSAAILAWLQYRQQRGEKRDDFHLELYARAVTDLASDKIDVRVAGLHALARLVDLSSAYRKAAGNVLLTYVRDRRPVHDAPKDSSAAADSLPPDVQTALTLLVERPAPSFGMSHLELQELDLSGAKLNHARLERADLTRTRLVDARLAGARLNEADLTRASLLRADLTDSHWEGTTLVGTELRGARLAGGSGTPFSCTDVSWPESGPPPHLSAAGPRDAAASTADATWSSTQPETSGRD